MSNKCGSSPPKPWQLTKDKLRDDIREVKQQMNTMMIMMFNMSKDISNLTQKPYHSRHSPHPKSPPRPNTTKQYRELYYEAAWENFDKVASSYHTPETTIKCERREMVEETKKTPYKEKNEDNGVETEHESEIVEEPNNGNMLIKIDVEEVLQEKKSKDKNVEDNCPFEFESKTNTLIPLGHSKTYKSTIRAEHKREKKNLNGAEIERVSQKHKPALALIVTKREEKGKIKVRKKCLSMFNEVYMELKLISDAIDHPDLRTNPHQPGEYDPFASPKTLVNFCGKEIGSPNTLTNLVELEFPMPSPKTLGLDDVKTMATQSGQANLIECVPTSTTHSAQVLSKKMSLFHSAHVY